MKWHLVWRDPVLEDETLTWFSVDGLWRVVLFLNPTRIIRDSPFEAHRKDNSAHGWYFMGRSPTWENAIQNIQVDAQFDQCGQCRRIIYDDDTRERAHKDRFPQACTACTLTGAPPGLPMVPIFKRSKHWNRRVWNKRK